MRLLILSSVFIAAALGAVPVREACTEDAAIVANVGESDAVQVRHAVVGETLPCYAVSVTQAGTEVRGYVLGNTLAAVQKFERARALESRVPLVEAPPLAAAAPKNSRLALPGGPLFEPWSGIAIGGRRVQIPPSDAKVTLVTFWMPQSGAARHVAEGLLKVQSEFGRQGLRLYGMVDGANVARANYYLDDMGLDYPQAFDRQGLAAKYNADPAKGATLVIDASSNIVAVSSNLVEIRAIVAKLLSSK